MSLVQVKSSAASRSDAQPHFIVGQDPQGRWLAIEAHNLAGGLFKSREDAIHFIDRETGHRPDAFELATAPLHLTF